MTTAEQGRERRRNRKIRIEQKRKDKEKTYRRNDERLWGGKVEKKARKKRKS